MKNSLLLTTIGLVLLFSTTGSAWALQYGVLGFDMTPSNLNVPAPERYYWTGTWGSNYVMSSPKITFQHVNSIYVRKANGDGYEFGWLWPVGGRPRWFAAKNIAGKFTKVDLAYATPGTNNYFSISLDSRESPPKTRYRLNGSLVYTDNDLKFPDGYSVWGSERQKTDETNYAHFWSLHKRRHDFTWVYWQNHEMFGDNDPGYRWYWLRETEGKSIKG